MTKEELKILCVVCLGTFLFFNSLSAIHVAVPTIQREFGANLALIQWVSIIGVVMISSLSLCFGRAGDILGRRKLYRMGVALYALGSGLVALSQSVLQLLIFRGVTTVGLAMAVALIELMMGGKGFEDPAAFTSAQQFAFRALLPLAGAAIVVSLLKRKSQQV